MNPVSLYLEQRLPAHHGITLYAEHLTRALATADVSARIARVPTRIGRRVGGVVSTPIDFVLRSIPPDGTVHHVLQPEIAWRGAHVVTVHDPPVPPPPGTPESFGRPPSRTDRFVFDRLLARRGVTIVAPAAWVVDYLRRRGVRDAVLVPVPRPIPEPSPYAEKDLDVLWVGRVVRNKGPLEFLRWLGGVPRRLRVLFVARTDVAYPDYIRETLAAMGVAQARHAFEAVLTPVDGATMDEYYRRAKVVVSTSNHEGFHLPPWEGYAYGARIFVPDLPIYTMTYGAAPGVTYYPIDEPASWADRLLAVVDGGPFEPDRRIIEPLSYSSVGRALAGIYRRHSGDLS